MGKCPAHNRTNRNGERLIGICQNAGLKPMTTYFKAKASKNTCVSRNSRIGKFQLDLVAISKKFYREIQNVKLRRAVNMTSNHFLSQFKIKMISAKKRKIGGGFRIRKIYRDNLFKTMRYFRFIKKREFEI